MDQTVDNTKDNAKPSAFGLEVVSDLSPVHQILSKQSLSFNEAKPKIIQPLPAKQRNAMIHSNPMMNPRLLQVAKVMSPATIHRVHQIVSPSEAGTQIQKFDSNLGDPDL